MYVPNTLGVITVIIQLVLLGIFGKKVPSDLEEASRYMDGGDSAAKAENKRPGDNQDTNLASLGLIYSIYIYIDLVVVCLACY